MHRVPFSESDSSDSTGSREFIRIPGSSVSIVFKPGALAEVGEHVCALGGRRVVLVTDKGIRDAGHLERAMRSLYAADLAVVLFDKVTENPTTNTVLACWRAAHRFSPDLIVGLGGGSSMDTAKGFNFLFTNGGTMKDYWGAGKAAKPMLPFIAIPTTAGTGSEAQSYALISDAETHIKMACGDKKALARLAILDADLTATQPPSVAAATAIDAITHAVETAASTRRNDVSRQLSRQSWEKLNSAFEAAMKNPADVDARSQMLMGAHLAGCAIENSMLGAAHATANPLTAEFGTTHGVAVGLMLPHVIRFNCAGGANPYEDLTGSPGQLADRIAHYHSLVRFPRTLRELQVPESALPRLAAAAAKQWTATFNPRKVGEEDLLEIYQRAW